MLEQIKQIKESIDKTKTVAFVAGNFNILHTGHQRLLKFAKENADILVVGVNEKDDLTDLIDKELRLEGILNSVFVDYALIVDDYLECILLLRPDIVVKGKEHENEENLEEELLKSYGGKLLFSSGTIGFSSFELLKKEFMNIDLNTIQTPVEYFNRHNIYKKNLKDIIDNFQNLNIAVFGDTIVDEYIICDPVGMSQEDPTIVVTPLSNQLFLGGASIVAAHARGLGANVDYYSVIGEDSTTNYVKDMLDNYKVNSFLYKDKTRPTTLKQRFRASDKTLLRVNHLKSHSIAKEFQQKILEKFRELKSKYDLVIFSDFSYGSLPKTLVDNITRICNENNIFISADSQSSSQNGDICRFINANLLTPTEREARLGINDFESGLVVLSDKIQKKLNCQYLITTLGKEGILIFAGRNQKGDILIDKLSALNISPKDVAGAGDSFLTATSLSLALGNNIWESAYIGSLCAAIQVGRLGNVPIQKDEVLKELQI
ncbi:PfkB family carbohydrate kinase [Arcobacter sp. FWKO B]|uniref:PfkB family carbohydrate kinase n=1 Tax=Arcobacter sp. FWKO B TaxID=2593672 RepID=UPI0018A632A6|nr:PfkB family carbohydrate kinase [Arcobacter sp. FWKO B]QOG12171.1 adenylyltransferase/cytidyltransferase family protein [Arcobacter sp. FWKO B]